MRVNRSDVLSALKFWESQGTQQLAVDVKAEPRRSLIGFLTLMNFHGVEEAVLFADSELAQLLSIAKTTITN